jgi:hypothetical protein
MWASSVEQTNAGHADFLKTLYHQKDHWSTVTPSDNKTQTNKEETNG